MNIRNSPLFKLINSFKYKYIDKKYNPHFSYSLSEHHIYNIIWGIGNNYAGMTSAMLYRCKQFCDFNVGASYTILTLQISLNTKKVESHIQSRWNIPKAVRVRNIWEDLRNMDDKELHSLVGDTPSEKGQNASLREDHNYSKRFFREYKNNKGVILWQQHTRKNNSLLILHEHAKKNQRIVLYCKSGFPIKQWHSIDDLYLSWIEHTLIRLPAILVNEHRLIGNFLYRLEKAGVKTVQVIHGSHLKSSHFDSYSELTASRANTIRNISSFNLVSLLTDWQKQDLINLGIDQSNLHVLPNATKQVTNQLNDRHKNTGVVIARLSAGKQINHSIRALSNIENVILSIYGSGEEEQTLKSISNTLKLSNRICFKGHVDNASSHLIKYSFLLFTSTAEGQGLVLLEAMAHGCIPISYDIRYGPSDIITHGVNGFLVKPNDVNSLANTIIHFLSLPDDTISTMRLAAIERVKYFSSHNNISRWKKSFNTMISTPTIANYRYSEEFKANVNHVCISDGICYLKGYVIGNNNDLTTNSKVIVTTRSKAAFIKVTANISLHDNNTAIFNASFSLCSLPLAEISILDFFIQPSNAYWHHKSRLYYALTENKVIFPEGKAYKTQHGNLSLDLRKRAILSDKLD